MYIYLLTTELLWFLRNLKLRLDQWRRLKEGIPERLIPDRVEYGATEEKGKDQPAR